MSSRRPFFLTFIGYFYVFGAVVLLISLGTGQDPSMALRMGMIDAPETVVRLLVATLALVMAYGYLRLTSWGFWLMMTYSALFLVMSLFLDGWRGEQPFLGNVIWSTMVLGYTFWQRKRFLLAAE